jgi:lipoate-protein ligase A
VTTHPPAPLQWRHLISPPLDGAANMAWDLALMARARRTGQAVLRIYAWRSPTISLGRNQTARGAYDLARAASRGVTFVRRPTGGRALLHYHEVTYSVTAPEAFDPSLRGAYTRINAILLDALTRLGVRAELAGARMHTPSPGLSPCFAQPSQGEIVADGHKLVGSAQWRQDGALLQHGSILMEDDQQLIGDLLATPNPVPTPPAATLASLLGAEPRFDAVANALVDALRAAVPETQPLHPATDAVLSRAVERETTTFVDDTWTWRR